MSRSGAATAPDPALRREVGTAYLRMGDALAATGDTRGALSFAQQGLTLHKEAGTAAPVSAEARRATRGSGTAAWAICSRRRVTSRSRSRIGAPPSRSCRRWP